MTEWARPGLPGGHLSIAELDYITSVAGCRVRYDHDPNSPLLQNVRIQADA